MANTSAGTILVSKETSCTSINTYYNAILASTPNVQGSVLSFNIQITITIGSSSGLGIGAANNRTAYVYDSSGNLIGSQLIKNNTTWAAGQSYTYTIPCSTQISGYSGTLNGLYIRIQYTQEQAYGSIASCYWNGQSNVSGGSVGNTFSISYEAPNYTITLIAGNAIAGVSGAGTYAPGTQVQVSCTFSDFSGFNVVFSEWTSSDTSLVANSTQQTYTFTMPAGNVTLTASGVMVGKPFIVTFDPNGGQVSPAQKTVTYEQPYGALPTPTMSGKIFSGWMDSNGNIITAYNLVIIPQNHTLTAQWETMPGSGKLYINGSWVSGNAYIYTGGTWVHAVPYIYNNNTWEVTQ